MEKSIFIRPYTHLQLTLLYGVSSPTLRLWLKPFEKEIGPKIGHFYNSRQVQIIFRCIGPPSMPVEGDN